MNAERLKQIEEIYHAALEILPGEREIFFRENCGADENLRREVESLLSFENTFDSLIDTPPESLAAEMFIEQANPRANLAGKEISHYRIKQLLGKGGMGEVYLAEDANLNRRVALKFLSVSMLDDKNPLRRFEQEAFAASALNHPNILTIYEFDAKGEMCFIAAEFIEGKTLREIIGEHPASLAELLDAAIQIVEALAAAHAVGVVHRDIKPENIMIRSDGYVKVLDFGLAKLTEKYNLEADSEAATQKFIKTNPGVFMGTINYMSPEQARGKEVNTRSDIFSFGIVLYELITGKLPFEGESMADVWAAILNREPLPLEQFVADVPKELQRIVNKTLRKKQTERYQSTVDLLGDLKDLREELTHEAKLERSGKSDKSRISTSSGGSKDALLLTEFENLTGEAVFDRTLKTALAFSLEQSPFLDIFADERVSQTLRLMRRSSDDRVTRELGKEICQRKGLKAFIAGTISTLGTSYVLSLEAVNAQTGETIGQYVTLDWQTNSSAFLGQWRKSQDFSRRSVDLVIRSETAEVAAQYAAEQALRIVFWSSGAGLPEPNSNQLQLALKTQTRKALKLERNKDTLTRSALALAIAGQTSEAEKLIEELKTEYPKDTLVHGLWLPMINAALRLHNGKLKEAIEELETAERFEPAAEFYPQYLRGLIYLKLGKAKKAAVEFEKILNHRGESPLSTLYPLAQLGKARVAKNKVEYEKFFEFWKDADKDMPALVEAKKEYDDTKTI